jgi:glycyl-tRNA synthetase alpha chain
VKFSFFEIANKLQEFWIKQGAIPIFPCNFYVGAGTFHPACFFSSLEEKKSAYTFVQKSTRKADGRFGESPNRFLNHHQLEVIFTPEPENINELFFASLEYIGIDRKHHFIQFNDNNWENISIGAIGVGWEILCNNTEICQFTYFQKMADIDLKFNTVELAYGLERIAFILWQKNVYEIPWYENASYGEICFESEKQFSKFFLEKNEPKEEDFFKYEKIIFSLLDENLFLPAYENLIQMIDVFNSLDAKKLISQVQRKEYIDLLRHLANSVAKNFLQNTIK